MYHCIVNPAAGRGSGRRLIPVIKSFMKNHGKEIEIKETVNPMDAAKWAKEACAAGSRSIIGVGGDGTLQEIVTGMLDGHDKCDTPLGVISCGSGDDWRRSFGQEAGAEACLAAVLGGKTKVVDAIRANDMVCLNISNMGLDVRIVRNAQPLKKFFGKSSYVISAVISILKHKNVRLVVDIGDGKVIEGDFTLAAICNGQYYGGGMRITPPAKMDDGLITLCLVSAMSRLRVLTLFPVMLAEKHTKLKAIRYIECKQITLTPLSPQTLCIDGNLYECEGSLDFKILPEALRIFTGEY